MGGVLVIGLTLLVGTTDYNGAGMEVVGRAIGGEIGGWAWLLKLLVSAVTIGDAMGQFTAPQNTATSPMAAPKPFSCRWP